MRFGYFILAAGAYYIAGRLGLLLAIPPGFASAVWPAAGIALSCLLLSRRWQLALGVAFGSFCLNLGVVSGNFTTLSWAMLPVPATIGLGAALQAGLGYWLYRKTIGETLCLDAPRQICWFLLVVSPLSCLVGASVGTSALLWHGVINSANGVFTWFTWWTGDTIGTMLIAPLLLALFAREPEVAWPRRLIIVLPTVVFFSCILLLFTWSSANQRKYVDFYVQQEGAELFNAVEDRLEAAINILKAYDALVSGSEQVTLKEFNTVSSIMVRDSDVFKAVGWIPRLKHQDRSVFERTMRTALEADFYLTELDADGELTNAREQPVYFPVQYLYPLKGNLRALGLNLGAIPSRLKALEDAQALRRPVATEPIQLVQSPPNTPSMILYYPIFSRDNNNDKSQHSRTQLLGYISGVFTFSELLDDVANKASLKKLAMSAADVTEQNNSVRLLTSRSSPLTGHAPQTYTLSFGERLFELSFAATDQFALAAKDWTSWNILTFGFLLASLMQAFILLITGNTERIRAEVARKTHQLTLSKEQAEQANIAKTNFLANMSHELRTPLNAVTGLITLCLKTPLNTQQQHYLSKAKLASSTLMALINQTLDYSKIEAGNFSLERTKFSLRHILEKLHAVFDTEATSRGLTLTYRLPEQIPERFIGDPLRIEQILLNLCGNAIKFTNAGQITITLHPIAVPEQSKLATLHFDIEDTGIGIDPNHLPNLFGAFQQADSSTTRKYGGTGLGLSICQKLAQSMNGNIEIASQQGKGTKVTAKLQVQVENPHAMVSLGDWSNIQEDPMAEPSMPTTLKTNVLSGKRVLVVEDIPINQDIARYLLEDYGATVTTADNGLHAIAILEEDPNFDLIFMDIQMPEMDGLEATRQIRARSHLSHLVIIAMTANAVKHDVDACKAAGMNDHVAKPIEESDLLSKATKHLRT